MDKKEAYLKNLKKYQMVGWLDDYFKKNGEPKNIKISVLKRKTYVDILDWMFKNIKKDVPKITKEFVEMVKSTYTSAGSSANISTKISKKTGIKKLTDEEQKELITKDDFSSIYQGKTPLKGENKIIDLQEHQKRFLQGYMFGNLKSAIVFHGVGTGKTLTAVATISLYLRLFKNNKVFIITPPAVMFNFIDSLIGFGLNPLDKRIEYYSYQKFADAKKDLSNALLVVDEAHNLRTEIKGVKDLDDTNKPISGIRPFKFLLKTNDAHKVVLLTATPFVNVPYDIENLLAIGDGRFPYSQSTFSGIVSNRDNIYDYFKYRISYYTNESSIDLFPENRQKYIYFIVDPKSEEGQAIKADAGGRGENPVYVRTRVASIEDRKMEFIMDKIKENPTKKYVIYTSFLEKGVQKLGEILKENNIDYGIVSGSVSTIEKKNAIESYRNFDNPKFEGIKLRVLIITRAGAEGVDLNNTRAIFVMDGVWNEATYEQIVARAIRYKSHHDLPKKERFVEVYKLFAVYPSEDKILDKLNEGGLFDFQRFLDEFNENKKALGAVGRKEKKLGRRLTSKEYQEVLAKQEKKMGGAKFEQVEFDKLKKGSKERKEYLESEKIFAKDKAKYETQDNLKKFKSLQKGETQNVYPSTDFYMFVLQKTKFLKVERIIRDISNIPQVEDVIYGKTTKIKEVRKFYDSLLKLKSGEEVFKKLVNYLIPLANKGAREIERNIEKEGSDIYEYIANRKDIEKAFKDKMKIRINQEFFTPDSIVKELINLSGIRNLKKATTNNLRILEPSAGFGNIVRGLLQIFGVKKINMTIDLVEIVEENRNELIKLQQQMPSIINVQNQPDFLKFFPSGDYNYIFMNPPFHLKKNKKNNLISDVFDYDFVKRAYSFLDLNGVLVAITGRNYEKNKEAIKFYKSIDAKLYNRETEWKGENLKKGSEIKKLKMTYIFIRKLNQDFALDREIQDIKFYN